MSPDLSYLAILVVLIPLVGGVGPTRYVAMLLCRCATVVIVIFGPVIIHCIVTIIAIVV